MKSGYTLHIHGKHPYLCGQFLTLNLHYDAPNQSPVGYFICSGHRVTPIYSGAKHARRIWEMWLLRRCPARPTNGQWRNNHKKLLTCAHKTLAFGTKVGVTRLDNGKSVVVRVNDRGALHRWIRNGYFPEVAETIGLVRDGVTLGKNYDRRGRAGRQSDRCIQPGVAERIGTHNLFDHDNDSPKKRN